MRVLGMNSGTACDGIDLALCEFKQVERNENGTGTLSLKVIAYDEVPHDIKLKQRILSMINKKSGDLAEITQLNFLVGKAFADAIRQFLDKNGLTNDDIDVIAPHGITMWHQVDDDSEVKSTWQNGESSVIVKETGRTVVNDMRVADMVYGGQGAPLTSFLDVVLCAEEGRTRAYQNLGGISNTTFVSMKNGIITAFAFDQGPSNVLIDRAVRHYTGGQQQFDKDGQMASRGKVNTELLQELLQNPYYKKQLPKTTGRELFSDSYADEVIKRCEELNMSPDDVVATITQLTIDTVVQSYHDFMPEPVEEIFVHGGGGFNPVVMEGIRKGLPNTKVTLLTKEEYGLPASCKEAAMFALIGHECIHGRPGQIPSCTGASQYTVLGKITPGSNYHELIRKIAQEPVQSFDKTVKLVIEK